MKKALAILMVLALVASAVTAEVTVGAWGRGIFLPVYDNADDTTTDTGPSWGGWGGDTSRIGFTINGVSDNVGFQIDANVDGGAPGLGDVQKIWVKPMDMITVSMGNIFDDTLRGNAAFGSFNWYRALGNGDGEDVTFSRIGINRTVEGFEVAVKPTDAIYAAIYFYDLDKNLTENLFSNMQVAFGYKIDGVGQIKAQVMTKATYETVATGGFGYSDADNDPATAPTWGPIVTTATTRDKDDMQTTIEVAFNYVGVENLFVEAGFAMATNDDIPTTISFNGVSGQAESWKKVALYAKYNMAPMTIHFSSINQMFKAIDTEVLYKVIAGLDYDIGDGVGVEADVSYTGVTIDDVDGIVTFFAGAKKGFSNGVIGAGVQVLNDGSDTSFGIPVRMEYWF